MMDSDSQCQNSGFGESSARLIKRGAWSGEEDDLLINYMKEHQLKGSWRKVPLEAGLMRSGKSCRLRWMNYLHPDVKIGDITPDEKDLIFRLHKLLGNRWSLIAGRLPGRTDNEIKNYLKSHIRKNLTKTKNTPNVSYRSKQGKRIKEIPRYGSSNLHQSHEPIKNVDTPFDLGANKMTTSSSMCLHENLIKEKNTSTTSSTNYLESTPNDEIRLDSIPIDMSNRKGVASIIEEGIIDILSPIEKNISWIDDYIEESQNYHLYPQI